MMQFPEILRNRPESTSHAGIASMRCSEPHMHRFFSRSKRYIYGTDASGNSIDPATLCLACPLKLRFCKKVQLHLMRVSV